MTRLVILLLWLLHWLPFPLISWVGGGLGRLLWAVNRERREATLTNLRLCFPQLGPSVRQKVARRHFVVFAQAALDRALLWWASPARLKRLIRLEGLEHLDALSGQPVILLAPHFVGLDVGWTRLTLERNMVTMYAKVKGAAFDAAVRAGRTRFGQQTLFSRQDGLKPAVAALRQGTPFYYLPDLDYGPDDATFVPFFGVPAATLTALPRLAKIADARVLLVATRRSRRGYVTRISPPWPGYPGGDLGADTWRMNTEIEAAVLDGDMAQYFWSHKRFKTRPPGATSVY